PKRWPALACLLIAAGLAGGCSRTEETQSSAAATTNAESRVRHAANGTVIVTLDEATRKLIGLQTAALEAERLAPERKAYGRGRDTAPLASLVAEFSASQASREASQAEVKRLKTLAAQNNASARAFESAQAAAARD